MIASNPTVLLVCDELHQCDFYADCLKSFGHKVVVAHSGIDAIKKIQTRQKRPRNQFRLVIIKRNFAAGVDGIELAEVLNKLEPSLSMVLMTSFHDDAEVLAAAKAAGIKMIISPPRRADEFRRPLALLD